MDFKSLIEKLDRVEQGHALLINTLSYLEYVGARKILKSQHESDVSLETLTHASEEIRHAVVLKKLALRLSDEKVHSYSEHHLIAPQAAKTYIQSVDLSANKLLGDELSPSQCYLVTTLLLEERAKLVYPIYDSWLQNRNKGTVFQKILKEEDLHLEQVLREIENQSPALRECLAQLRKEEDRLFTTFLETINEEADQKRVV